MPDIQAQTPDGVTHSFPEGTPDEVIDRVVKDHIQNVMPYTEAGAAATPPVAPPGPVMNKVNMVGEQITPRMEGLAGEAKNNMITPVTNATTGIMPVAGAMGVGREGIAKGLNTLARGTVGAAGGAAAGRYGGRAIGGMVGQPEAGETIGSLAGGLAGGYAGVKSIPEEEVPLPTRAHAEMEQDLASRAAKTPESISQRKLVQNRSDIAAGVKMDPAVQAHAEMEQDIQQGKQQRASARDTAHEDLAQARMRRGREQERMDEGSTVGGEGKKVPLFPEPNKPGPGEDPNNQQSVPRRELAHNARRGKEGAALQYGQVRGPYLISPKGAGYSGVRESIPADTIGKGPIGASDKPFSMEDSLQNETNKEMSKPETSDRRQNTELRQAIDKLKDSPNEALQHFQRALELARKPQK